MLLRAIPQPRCNLDAEASEHPPAAISASLRCWREAWKAAASKHAKLAAAVTIREAAVQSAAKAAVR